MATWEEVAAQALAVRHKIEAVEKVAEGIDSLTLDATIQELHDELNAAWAMARDHFGVPAPRSGGIPKPQ